MPNPAGALLRAFDNPQWQWLLRYLVVGFAICIAASVGLGGYSGMGVPPMYGDFEAQRHWLEITQHLPPKQWYFYDLQWWGLDYPPLTAYHSWVLGKVGSWINPEWFALDSSRGYESAALKAFMRQTVLASEALTYLPAVFFYSLQARELFDLPVLDWALQLGTVLLQPTLLLVDNGHFQYNSVMLGLFVFSLYFLGSKHLVPASICFVSAMFFKQMALYYSPVIFFAILGCTTSIRPLNIKFGSLVAVGTTVIVTCLLLLCPFLQKDLLAQLVIRVFPFSRGLWEDKVASLWCTANTFIKFKVLFSDAQLRQFALIATLVGMSPSCIQAYRRPTKTVLPWCFASCSWAFFLFSFHVHEKNVLLPLMPTTLLFFTSDQTTRAMVAWINNVAYFSMWPLLKRDGLAWQYCIVVILWNYLFGLWKAQPTRIFHQLVVAGSYAAIGLVCITEKFGLMPMLDKYPDLWTVANITISFACFVYFWLWQTVAMLLTK
ncbi:putative dolichyl pyrophosphate Man9GlcNAc2 alpha-1,3-glucosyltransferase [Wickerhamiella sorbophila]|uniref:Alpha-1,3-glucosyltransferase n=1 Tax=Wickerhamiella sorbophila TaxID=45607 RepID=A0A2T0FIM9_9ASCO|nr:putative dolichyl pyrophosphate Man9GlcNAc2 alpha-1,3-glucosyltransferase [Wickerhamiella sorbophila]PRT54840.1 putative dolichyl pyrophosphate Man9GlcNAc2 alpha-1,3-glucosyltransferase [Wickerhamiella sorbophila]